MYQLDWVQQLVRKSRPGARAGERPAVKANVWYLGWTSCLTDISSEMVNGILPLYLVGFLRLSPLQFGVVDGLYQGVSAVLRLVGGVVSDRFRRHKETAAAGYALSAVCKLGLLATGTSWPALAGVIALDRTGKGLRTAPRDALITMSSEASSLGASFGVHRALDAAGALAGPLVAFLILGWAPDAFDVIFVTSFCFAIVGLGVLLFFVEGDAEGGAGAAGRGPRTPGPATWETVTLLLRGTGFGYLVVAASVLGLATISDAFVYLTLQQRLQFSPTVFPLLYVATSLVYMALAIPAGRLADRLGSRAVFLAGYGLLGLVYLALLMPGTGSYGAVLGICALGGYYAATDGVLMALAGRSLPKAHVATGMAVLTTATSLTRFLSSVAFGWFWTTGDAGAAVRVFGIGLTLSIILAAVALSRVTGPTGPVIGAGTDHGIQ